MINETFERGGATLIRRIQIRDRTYVSEAEDLASPGITADEAWWQSFLRGAKVQSDRSAARSSLRIVDAFCGCGGLSLGVVQAAEALGWHASPSAAIDTDSTALSVYKSNFPDAITLNRNVSSLVDFHVSSRGSEAHFPYEPEVIEPSLTALSGNTDVFLAGPPCEGHSNLNNKTRRDDPRNLLYSSAIALGVALAARVIIVENVPEVERDSNAVVETAKGLLSSAGYRFLDWDVLAADSLGGAQTRKRFFLVAVSPKTRFAAVRLKHVKRALTRRPRTVEWAIGDLLTVSQDDFLNQTALLSEENQRRIDFLFDNKLYDLPNEVRPECHQNGTTYNSVYGRLRWDRPSGTITTGFLTPGRGRFIHPLMRRTLTPREAARLQFFPDGFNFVPDTGTIQTKKALGKWIGDAVPPLLGYAAALGALAALTT
jgi:DNA (cytosine-5)-methyltransferase 1